MKSGKQPEPIDETKFVEQVNEELVGFDESCDGLQHQHVTIEHLRATLEALVEEDLQRTTNAATIRCCVLKTLETAATAERCSGLFLWV